MSEPASELLTQSAPRARAGERAVGTAPGEADRAQRGRAISITGWDFGAELAPREEERGTLHEQVQAGSEFTELRKRLRAFVFPMAAAFLLWYIAFVLLASYARGLMATPVLGVINLGLVIGLAQFVTTFALTAAYVRFAQRRLDPLAARIRERVEDHALEDGAPQIGRVR